MPVVQAEGLIKHFGEVKALCGVDFEVEAGTVLGVLGPNGAGKTTSVRILTTLLKPDGDRATIDGIDVTEKPWRVRARIGLTGQYAAVDERLTARENLELVGRFFRMSGGSARLRATELLDGLDLDEAGDRVVKGFSGGMRRRLDIAMSLVARPKVLFLDEPTTGLDPRSRLTMWEMIKELSGGLRRRLDLAMSLVARPSVLFLDEPTTGLDPRSRLAMWDLIDELVRDGTTTLLTTQYLEEADRLASSIVVIDHGSVIASGSPDELKRRIGGERLEVTLTHRSDVPQALLVLAPFACGAEHVSDLDPTVTVPIERSTGIVPAAVRALDLADVKVDDVVVRRPTLDDVFLQLTGHAAVEEG